MRSTIMYCHKINDKYMHFYLNQGQVNMCGKHPVYKVCVTETKESDDCYWAWWWLLSKPEHFSTVNHNKNGVEICFPYGTAHEERWGKGFLLPVEIKEIKEIKYG